MDSFEPVACPECLNSEFRHIAPEIDETFQSEWNGEEVVRPNDYEENVRKAIVSAYEKGVAKGLEEALFWKRKAGEEIAGIIASAVEQKRTLLASLEGAVVSLSVAIAEKVIRTEIDSNIKKVIEKQIDVCLKQLDQDVPVLLRLNPDDIHVVGELIQEQKEKYSLLNEVRLVEDRRVDRGGCILETDKGALRATISEQLNKIYEALESEYARAITEEMGSAPIDGFSD